MKKVILAFSGGLDTSFCAIYLAKEKAFLQRATETAFTAREVEFIAKTLSAAKGQANGIEYGVHRFLIQRGRNILVQQADLSPQASTAIAVIQVFDIPLVIKLLSAKLFLPFDFFRCRGHEEKYYL